MSVYAVWLLQGPLVADPVTMVRVTFAENIALIAETALRSLPVLLTSLHFSIIICHH